MMIPNRRKLGAAALIIAGIGAFLVPFLLHSSTTQGTSPNNNNNNGNHAKDFTSSSIVCSPSAIASGGASSCTATVPDTTTSSNTPTGTVSFTSSNPGIGQVAASCTLSAGKCTTDFTGVAPGTVTVTGTYSGDSGHNGSSGSSNVVIATQTGGGTTDTSGGTTSSTGTCADENSSHGDASDKTDRASTTGNSDDSSVSHKAKDNSDSSKPNQGHAYGSLKNQLDTTVALVKSMGIHNSAFHSHHDTKTDNDTVHTEQASSESSNDHDSSCAEKEETNDD